MSEVLTLGSLFDGSGTFPNSDSASYKMWGNGICSANAWYVLAGIQFYANNENKE